MRIAVTGSSGLLGRATVDRLTAEGHSVLGFDMAPPPGGGLFTRVDLTDYGQTLDALMGVTGRHRGLDAVIHLAAIPVSGMVPDATTFHKNMTVSFNVLFAAHRAGIRRIVSASSINANGFPFEEAPPALPVDESHTAANNVYGLTKLLEETLAGQLVRWDPELSITALRFTNVVAPDGYGSFARAGELTHRRDLLGSYVDVRDGALAVALALAAGTPGLEVYNIAAPDSGSTIPSAELAERWFPGTPVAPGLGEFESLISTRKAQERLGFRAQHRWQDEFRAGL
ncbi:MAG: NAD(P)-dependent oxidoreductase [Actinomycetota bacterium]|nr:NAD(P)-dependent oxidoreductase [Actinomycetota bacterium]